MWMMKAIWMAWTLMLACAGCASSASSTSPTPTDDAAADGADGPSSLTVDDAARDAALDRDVAWSEAGFDASGCGSRPLACAPGEDATAALRAALHTCAAYCARLTATFDAAGCLTAVAYEHEGLSAPLPECLRAKLEDARWTCATEAQARTTACPAGA